MTFYVVWYLKRDITWKGLPCSYPERATAFISLLQAPDSADGGKIAPRSAFKFSSVGSQFKKQLGDLMSQLHTMEPHYVRCVKPNGLNTPGLFENSNALHQLRCGGKAVSRVGHLGEHAVTAIELLLARLSR